jgi:hypothetical protein
MMGTLQFNNILHSKLLGDIQGINSISIYGQAHQLPGAPGNSGQRWLPRGDRLALRTSCFLPSPYRVMLVGFQIEKKKGQHRHHTFAFVYSYLPSEAYDSQDFLMSLLIGQRIECVLGELHVHLPPSAHRISTVPMRAPHISNKYIRAKYTMAELEAL